MQKRVLVVGLAVLLLAASPAAALDALAPGMKAPDFSLPSFDGRTLALSSLASSRGILVVFWSSWSEKSPELLARAEQLHRQLGGKGLGVVGVAVESVTASPEELAPARALAKKLGLTFPLLVDRGLVVFGAYGVVAVPTSVVLRGDGTVVGDLAAYPIAGREDFFDLVEATALGRAPARRPAVAGNQPNPRAVRYFNLARAMVARGLIDQVDGNLKKAIEIDPAFSLPRVLLGQIYRERAVTFEAIQGNGGPVQTLRLSDTERAAFLRDAEHILAGALTVDPASAPALVELAAIHAARREPAAARALLAKALAADASFAPARAQLGALLLRAGDVDAGRRELDAALKLNPLDWRLYLTAAHAYDEAGLPTDAMTHYRKGLELVWQARRDLFPLSYGR